MFRDVIHEKIHTIPANFFSDQVYGYIKEARHHSVEEVRSYASRIQNRYNLSMRYEDDSISLFFKPITSWGLGNLPAHDKVGLVIDVLESGESKTLSTKVDKMMKYFHVELAIIFDVDVDEGQGVNLKMWCIDWDEETKGLVAVERFHTVSTLKILLFPIPSHF